MNIELTPAEWNAYHITAELARDMTIEDIGLVVALTTQPPTTMIALVSRIALRDEVRERILRRLERN